MHLFTKYIAPVGLLIGLCFLVGWIAGQHGHKAWATIKQATTDSYMNRYRVMSDSELSSVVYYVSTKESTPLMELAASSNDIIDVTGTRIDDLYDVRMRYQSRVDTVKQLRSMSSIDAVITLPLICH